MEVKDLHVLADLSAYLDRELSPADQARVRAHLETCRECSARLGELRATATLIAALPAARPSRSLVPSVAPRWNWLRPVRSLSAVMSGAFVMLFLVTAVAQSGSDLGGGPDSPFGAALRGEPQPAAAPAAAPAAEAGQGAAELNAPPTETATTLAAQTQQAEDAAKRAAEGDAARQENAPDTRLQSEPAPPSPAIWLAVALLLAILAGVAHWRLRAAVA